MTFTILKIASYGFACLAPIAILVAVSRWMRARSVRIGKQRLVRAVLVPVVWVVGLIGSFAGHAFHEAKWLADNPDGIVTEEDMAAIGDFANVFAGWVILGWAPVALGLILSARLNQKNRLHNEWRGDR